MNDNDTAAQCLQVIEDFISQHEITCSETIYQTDRVSANAFEFIEALCEIAGYHEQG